MQILKESAADYNTFVGEITRKVSERMGEEYTVRVYKVIKNNSLELDSLVLMKEGRKFAPNIYLLPYYEAYAEGTGIEELVDRLCKAYRNCTVPLSDNNFTFSLEEMKPNIIYRLINYEKNSRLLEQIPHLRFLDLAITFHCLVHDDNDGIGTIRITNEHMKQWKITLKELQKLAVCNTRKQFPPVIRSMEEVIRRMLAKETGDDFNLPEEFCEERAFSDQNHHKMYILTNQKDINGATCLIYQNVLKEFATKLQSDLFILPSSIHEVILVPYDGNISKEALTNMVQDVNQTQVACDEVLSDKVYFFSREKNAVLF